MTSDLRSAPIITLSLASSNSDCVTMRLLRRLVDKVHQVGAGKSRRAAGNGLEVDIRRQRHLANVNLEDLFAADDIRIRYHHLAVETAGTQQRRIEHVGPVARRD